MSRGGSDEKGVADIVSICLERHQLEKIPLAVNCVSLEHLIVAVCDGGSQLLVSRFYVILNLLITFFLLLNLSVH